MNGSSPDEGETREGTAGSPAGVVEQSGGVGGHPAPDPRAQPAEAAGATTAATEASPLAATDPDLRHHLEMIGNRLETLHQDFESKLKYDEVKDRQLDALHAELQAHRDDLQFSILKPVLMDLIAMFDDMQGIARHEQQQDPTTLTEGELRMQRNLASFASTIEEILERYGVTAFVDEGDAVSPQRQRSIKQVETSDAAQDRRVAERVRKGFSHGAKVLRPEIVMTYRVRKTAAAELSDGGKQ